MNGRSAGARSAAGNGPVQGPWAPQSSRYQNSLLSDSPAYTRWLPVSYFHPIHTKNFSSCRTENTRLLHYKNNMVWPNVVHRKFVLYYDNMQMFHPDLASRQST